MSPPLQTASSKVHSTEEPHEPEETNTTTHHCHVGPADTSRIDGPDPQPELPFYPTSVYELLGSTVSVWWFELDFSQSTYGQHSSCHSNACTLIAVITAARLARRSTGQDIRLQLGAQSVPPVLPHTIVREFAESILLGNRVYCDLAEAGRLQHHNLNIPEAMEAAHAMIANVEEWDQMSVILRSMIGQYFHRIQTICEYYQFDYLTPIARYDHQKSFVYLDDMGRTLFNCLSEGLSAWWTENQAIARRRGHVFVVLITENRSILLVFQQSPAVITVFDSHQHSPDVGACIAQTTLDQLSSMCHWIRTMFADIYQVHPKCFELSYIQTVAADPALEPPSVS